MSKRPAYPFTAPGNNAGSRSKNPPGPPAAGARGQSRPHAQLAAPPRLKHDSTRSSSSTLVAGSPFATSTSSLLPASGQTDGKNREKDSSPLGPGIGSKGSELKSLAAAPSLGQSISDKYYLSADPSLWGANVSADFPEPDDELHNPDPRRDRKNDQTGTFFTSRGLANLGCLMILAVGLVALFAGYPLISYFTSVEFTTLGGYNLGGINASGQIPTMTGNWGLIDSDTPQEAYTKTTYTDNEEWELVFSDEFNLDGRSFYPGDDPYWEAVDLWYWGTVDLEWYDPAAVTTKDGNLVITMSKKDTHGLEYESGMVTSWNKFCFTGGMIEVSAVLPGSSSVWGLWPAVWTMGNLGRAGFGATNDGLWPYSYDTCDVGTLPNQTMPDGTPTVVAEGGSDDGPLSFLPGQRLSACTCDGEPHPGPKKSDGTYTGRAAPEIDVLEAKVFADTARGGNSQSAQWAPFNLGYLWDNTTTNQVFYDNGNDFAMNSYQGGVTQMTTSAIGPTNQDCYERDTGCHAIYGFEYKPGNDGFITWINDGKASWTFRAAGLGPKDDVKIGQREVSKEPMYVIMNLAMSHGFSSIDFDNLVFPAHFLIDYVRIYQPKDQKNIGCSPEDYPTEDYINQFMEAYTNPELMYWEKDYKQTWPKNRLVDNC